MKNYLPVLIGVLILAGAGIFVWQYSSRQSTPLTRQEVNIATDASSVSPTVATKETTVMVTGITLTISTPSNNTTVSSSSLAVKGKTVAGAEVFVNDLETKADASGNFSVIMTLEEGDNYILIVANDAAGNYSEKELSVTYTP